MGMFYVDLRNGDDSIRQSKLRKALEKTERKPYQSNDGFNDIKWEYI